MAKSELQKQKFAGFQYQRLTKDTRDELRGAVSLLGEEQGELRGKIPGFPPIRRTYRLWKGIRRLFHDQSFYAEEKLDGYNVRIFQHSGGIYALTRGGFICPFTTEWAGIWAEKFGLREFFRDHPSRVICGEVVGDNPYNRQRQPHLPAGAHFYLFEIMNPDGSFLPPPDRYHLAQEYNLPAVPSLGIFDSEKIQELYRELRRLNEEGGEGVVLKSPQANRFLKFVTPNTDLEDIRDAMPVSFELPSGYLHNRIMRVSLFSQELGLDEEEYARKLGQALMHGCPRQDDFREASEQYLIYVRSRDTWKALRSNLAQQVLIAQDSMREVELDGRPMLRIAFRRIYKKSSNRFYRILRGYLHTD